MANAARLLSAVATLALAGAVAFGAYTFAVSTPGRYRVAQFEVDTGRGSTFEQDLQSEVWMIDTVTGESWKYVRGIFQSDDPDGIAIHNQFWLPNEVEARAKGRVLVDWQPKHFGVVQGGSQGTHWREREEKMRELYPEVGD
jgi:hypothetical protein